MRVVITGSNGTVGAELSNFLEMLKFDVIPWNRKEDSIDSEDESERFLKDCDPDVLIHLAALINFQGNEEKSWKVNCEWPSKLALFTNRLGIRFLFTSSVMVFTDENNGPYTVNSIADAGMGYGFEKRSAEINIIAGLGGAGVGPREAIDIKGIIVDIAL